MLPETVARRLLEQAVREGRSAELLTCLFDGGSATVDANGHLVLVSSDLLRQMVSRASEDE